ncbi:hypothetical protein FRB90_008746, partial [Tulasnella sp. 427]
YESNDVDSQWSVGVVTFGGYSLGVIVDAARQYQAPTSHPDILHLSSQFLRAATAGTLEVRISKVRVGNQFTNLAAELHQKGALKATAQLIFGNFDQLSTSAVAGASLPSSHAPLHPLVVHPANAKLTPSHWAQRFTMHYHWSRDLHFDEINSRHETEGKSVDGLQTGTWVRLTESPDVQMSPSYIPFFVDMIQPPWDILTEKYTQGRKFWYPSLSITIEFKCRLPLSSNYAAHTLGVFGRKRHLNDGIWSDTTEIWSAPAELGDEKAEVDSKWRENMVCVAVASQVAYMASPDINRRYAKGDKNALFSHVASDAPTPPLLIPSPRAVAEFYERRGSRFEPDISLTSLVSMPCDAARVNAGLTNPDVLAVQQTLVFVMAPLNKAIKVAHKSTLEDGTKVYECNADPEWAMAA